MKLLQIVILFGWVFAGCTMLEAPMISEAYDPAIAPYVTFLQTQNREPKEYLLDLFNQHDIVILCERNHKETTQYMLLYELVSDPRFVEQVGHIFTEIGTSTMQPEIDTFLLSTKDMSQVEVDEQLRHIYRNITWSVAWEKTNFYNFLKQLHTLNRSLPDHQKLHLYFSDVPFSWKGMTTSAYQDFERAVLPQRDRIMAEQILTRFAEIQNSDGQRKKALVIMNYRHAFNNLSLSDGSKTDNVGRYIFDAFPDRTANVLLNSLASLQGSTDQMTYYTPIQNGKWDAAFAALGNPDRGFDLEDSPFGSDQFDYARDQSYAAELQQLMYQDVFTGFIFYKPLSEHELAEGILGLFTWDEGMTTVYERATIVGMQLPPPDSPEVYARFEALVNPKVYAYEELAEFESQIDVWLKVPTTQRESR